MGNVQPPKPPNGRERPVKGNGAIEMDPRLLLRALSALGRGDFTVRLPDDWLGLGGKIADAFNGVVERNQRLAQELDRISKAVGKEGKLNQRASIGDVSGSWAESVRRRERPHRRPRRSPERKLAGHHRRRPRGPFAGDGHGDRGPGAAGRVPEDGAHRQHDGRAARLLRLRGHARGARGRQRRQAGRPGQGQGRGRHLEGPDGQRQLHGRQPDQPGPEHRRRDDRGRHRRPLEEDHRRRAAARCWS